MPVPQVCPNVRRFARRVAARLPGTWTADARPPAGHFGTDYSEVWDSQVLDWATTEFSPWKAAVLTGPHGEQLLAIAHPTRHSDFIIGALAPPGHSGRPRGDEAAPLAITVPPDPARAASLVTRRFLPRYDNAAAEVHNRDEHGDHRHQPARPGGGGASRVQQPAPPAATTRSGPRH